MLSNKTKIQTLVPTIKKELKLRKDTMAKRDRYGEGYVAALEDLLQIFKDAKLYMMDKVRNSL